MATLPFAPPPLPLPALRQELRVEPGAPLVNGAPSWTIFDPVRHAFFQIGRIEMAILSLWPGRSAQEVRAGLEQQGLDPDDAGRATAQMVEFCLAQGLTERPPGDAVATLSERRARTRRSWWRLAVDNYLFFRVPLVRPARFLERTLPLVAPLWSRTALVLFALAGLAGLLLVSRQWDAFVSTFLRFFSLEGLAAYGASLVLVKLVHELGHAYTATRLGCRVPTMGVSFLVMMPVLYTDTTAAWRLRSRADRLAIDAAGVAAELMLAVIAVLAWVLLPDGTLRSVAFVIGATSWLTTLAINLNPFMRFDGYYLLSDWLGVPNLQPRAFALGRWWLRERLFALGEPPPEALPRHLHRGLIAYAYATWIYRLFLYVAIALLVYHLFFKLLGILLFGVEMTMFVLRPIWSEMSGWAQRGEAIRRRGRHRWWLGAAGGLALLAVLPLDRHVTLPALMATIVDHPVVAGEPARVEAIHVREGDRVAAGAPLLTLASPDLDRQIAGRAVTLARIQAQLDRAIADAEDLSNRAVLERERLAEQDALAGLQRRRGRLVLRAPADGQVADLDRALHPGRWLNGSETLARIVTPGQHDAHGYVDGRDAARLAEGATGRFVPQDAGQPSVRVKLVERARSAADRIDARELASTAGGPLAVKDDASGAAIPLDAQYRVRMVVEAGTAGGAIEQKVPGTVRIDAAPISLAGSLFGWLTRTYHREASLQD